eukprot:g13498.t1
MMGRFCVVQKERQKELFSVPENLHSFTGKRISKECRLQCLSNSKISCCGVKERFCLHVFDLHEYLHERRQTFRLVLVTIVPEVKLEKDLERRD